MAEVNGNGHRRLWEPTFSLGNVINLVALLATGFVVVGQIKEEIGTIKRDVAVQAAVQAQADREHERRLRDLERARAGSGYREP